MAQDSDAEGYIDVDNTVLTPSPQRIRNILTLEERVNAIKAYQQRPMYTKVARMFNCSWEQIKNIISNREDIMEFYAATKIHKEFNKDDGPEMDQNQKKFKFLGECVYEYIQRVQFYQKIPITEELIRVKAMDFQEIIKLDGFTPNKNWINHFKINYNISLSNKQIVLTRVPPASLDLKDIMTYCTKYRSPSMSSYNSVHMRDLKQKYNSFDAKLAEYENRRVRKLNFLQRALNEYLHRAKFHHKTLNLDDESVQKVAESLNDILKVQDFYPSLTWINLFKNRHNNEAAEAENTSARADNHNSKRPLLSLDLKDILSYCGRMDNKSGPCTVTLTPKNSEAAFAMLKYPAVGESNLKFQQNSIIYLDDGEEGGTRDIKPDLEELKLKRLHQVVASEVPPLKIRKIESINNDPVLHRQLQQQQQQELQQQQIQQQQLHDEEKQQRIEMQESAKDEKIYIKHEIYIKNEKEDQIEATNHPTVITTTASSTSRLLPSSERSINNSSSSTTKLNNTQRILKPNTQADAAAVSPFKGNARSSGGESPWQVTNFEDALRFLKPLEEYAMLAENYRAIGLISQLEEVLKQQSLNKISTDDYNA